MIPLDDLCQIWANFHVLQSWNATRSKRAPLGQEGVKLERDTFQSGILD